MQHEALRIIDPLSVIIISAWFIYKTIKTRNRLSEIYRQRRELKNIAMTRNRLSEIYRQRRELKNIAMARNRLSEIYRQRRELKNIAMAGKYQLELNYPGDGRLYLNYWDWKRGNDVCCEVFLGPVNGFKIVHHGYESPESMVLLNKEITFHEFLSMVEDAVCETDRIIKPDRT